MYAKCSPHWSADPGEKHCHPLQSIELRRNRLGELCACQLSYLFATRGISHGLIRTLLDAALHVITPFGTACQQVESRCIRQLMKLQSAGTGVSLDN